MATPHVTTTPTARVSWAGRGACAPSKCHVVKQRKTLVYILCFVQEKDERSERIRLDGCG